MKPGTYVPSRNAAPGHRCLFPFDEPPSDIDRWTCPDAACCIEWNLAVEAASGVVSQPPPLMTRAEALDWLLAGATYDTGLGPALAADRALPALEALGVTAAEIDAAIGEDGYRQHWRKWT